MQLAALVGMVGIVLGAIYEGVPPVLKILAVAAMAVFGGASVLLTEPPEAEDAETLGGRSLDRFGQRPQTQRDSRPTQSEEPAPGRLSWWRTEVVPALPPGDEFFRGREAELAHLTQLHDQQRKDRAVGARPAWWWRRRRTPARPGRDAIGPVTLFVHGKPGVGKTALADELARRLAPQYPHGQVFVNLGTGGTARTPMEILKDFLLALGWDETETMPDTMVGRAMIFRSLTAKKRILFILDAARHADQVRNVLPADPAAAVIITSRRDLIRSDPLPEPSYPLDIPDADEAMSIFRALSRTSDSMRPECAAEIMELCGRLPLAIRSAAERVSLDGADICQVASLLREPRSRLTWLDRPGRPLRAHLQTEYGRLLPQEQRALAMLALIPASTFVPWVLGPLMDLPPDEVEALVDRLAAAQLVDDLGMDETSEVARYGLHPLVRLFAQEKAAELPEDERDRARTRLDEAYIDMVCAVLTLLHPQFESQRGRTLLAHGPMLPNRIAHRPEAWVRAEYPNLLRVVNPDRAIDDATELGLPWRVGAWLNGCVAAGVPPETTLAAYAEAARAAENDDDILGLVDVLLARATFLIAIERYRDAEACLDQVVELSGRLRSSGDDRTAVQAARRTAVATRKVGEAFLQAASYQQGLEALEYALTWAESIGDENEQRLIRILLAEAHHVDTPEVARDQLLDPGLTDATRYRVLLSLAETGRRRREWRSASDYFTQALRFVDGDLRRVATVQYRTARLLLDQHADAGATDGADPALPKPAASAARRAAAAAVTFRQMGNRLGVVRAHCLLARALLAMGHAIEADHLTHTIDGELVALQASGENPGVLAPLAARLNRVKGEVRLEVGDRRGGRRLLREAVTAFGEQRDWAGLQAGLRRLEETDDRGSGVPAIESASPVAAAGGTPREQAVVPAPVVNVNGPLTLSTSAAESLAVHLRDVVVDQVRNEVRQAFTPPTPIAFRGALGAGLVGADVVSGRDGQPVWRVPVAELCDLTVLVATGQRAFAGTDRDRPALAGARVWQRIAINTGSKADDVELTLMVDAPFIDVSGPEHSTTCRVDGGLVRHHSTLRVTEPGRYDLRIALLTSGRLVQSLPIMLKAGDDENVSGKPPEPSAQRDGVHHDQQ